MQFCDEADWQAAQSKPIIVIWWTGARATQEILKLAQMRKCDTIVIGRASLSWLGELIHGDPAEEFVRQGKGFTIWVVE